MPGDPDLDPQKKTAEVFAETVSRQQTKAPRQLAPPILASRAFREAPMLAERFKRGELPPVSERLPEDPLVVVPFEEVGKYGGTLRHALTGDIIQSAGVSKILSESLMGFERPLPRGVECNLVEGYQFLDEGRTALFRLRNGLRWSDGAPFTVDDILFYYYDMTFNDEARAEDMPVPPTIWVVDGRPIRLEKVDDRTLRVSSPRPLGRVLHALANTDNFAYPRHVLSRWHPKYSAGASYADFRRRTTGAMLLMTPGIPRLSAWVAKEWVRGQRLVYERNPYYWKVDSAGNQLPYADDLVFTVVQDPQVIQLKFMNGELDLFGRYSRIDMYPTLRAEEQKGRFRLYISGPFSGPALYLNWDCPKPALREAFRDIRVRVALSHAINREEINQTLYHGLLEPSGYSFGPSNPYFSEEAYQKYSEFDPERARALLDEAGYRDGDGDGFRELKDGSRFELNIDVMAPDFGRDVCELVAEQWREVGVKANLNGALRDIIWPRRLNGEFDIHHWGLEGPEDPLGRLNDWAIASPTSPFWHRNASKEGPEWLREATRCIEMALTTVDTARAREYMIRARDLHTENIPVIVVGSAYHVWGASARLGNVPEDGSSADVHRGWGRSVAHEQVYIKHD